MTKTFRVKVRINVHDGKITSGYIDEVIKEGSGHNNETVIMRDNTDSQDRTSLLLLIEKE